MAEALIAVVLEQLVIVSFDHTKEAGKLILNAKKEVEKFGSNLEAIQAGLEDAEKQQVENASVRNWLDKLNDVSYEMVDVLDERNTEILKQEVKKKTSKKVCFSIPSNCFCFGLVHKAIHLHKIATEMKELNEKLNLITAQKEKFEFHQSSTRRNDEQLKQHPETSSFVDISEIFGREEAKANLLRKLLSDSSEEGKRDLVIPIVGMGGIGKTTLAQLAYNNEDVKAYFEMRIWVCVSDPFDGVKIAKAIISGNGKDTPNSNKLQDVLLSMSECIKEKKCLIFLDDVWTEDQREWESLKLPIIMQTCAKGSKIVVTTRKERVAQIMGATSTQMIHLEKPVNWKKLRTLATFDSRMSSTGIKAISQLKCLRTLNLSHTYIGELPEEIGELIHLRYLDLSENDNLVKLPDGVGNLYNLQTLCLTGCYHLIALPENMGNLINLRHFHTWGCDLLYYLPRGMARLTSLQTLNRCPVTNDSGPTGKGLKLGDLGSLGQLQGSLQIEIKGNLKDTDTSEAQKALLSNKKLHYLKLYFRGLEEQSHVQVLEALRPHQDLENLGIYWYLTEFEIPFSFELV